MADFSKGREHQKAENQKVEYYTEYRDLFFENQLPIGHLSFRPFELSAL
jgi:hypothetical protein